MMVPREADEPSRASFKRVRHVVFDAVGTLIYPVPDVATVYHQIARRYGSKLDRDEIRSRFRSAFQAVEDRDIADGRGLETSEPREVERWRNIVTTVLDDTDDPDSAFADLFEHFAQPASWACFDDVAPVIAHLSASGFKIAVASNFDCRLLRVADGLPELAAIRTRVISSLVGWRKPAAQFYLLLLETLNAEPHEVLMVGDDFINDVQGAERSGLSAVLLDRSERRPQTAFQRHSDRCISSLSELIHWEGLLS